MKTRDLIAALQEADPSGDVECSIGGVDILSVTRLPGYYDGPYQVLVHHPEGYFPLGAQMRNDGEKVDIRTLSIEDMLATTPEAPVTLASAYADPSDALDRWAQAVAKWRRQAVDVNNEVEEIGFVCWAASRVSNDDAKAFWRANYAYNTPIPSIVEEGHAIPSSWNARRCRQYDHEVEITPDGLKMRQH